jgi:hypothetical protein
MVYWCPLVTARDVLQPGAALDDTAASESMAKLHDLAIQAQLSPLAVLPDHVVPTALHLTLQALSAYGPDVNLACIRCIGAICDVVASVDFTRARQTRLNLQQLGLVLPGLLIGTSPIRNECPKCGDWVSLMVLVFYEYRKTQTPGGDSLDARDLIEEIIAIQTAKSCTPGNIGDSAMDPDSVRHRYEIWGAYTCVKCAWRAITYARLARRGALRKPTVPPPELLLPSTGHSMSKRPRLHVSSAMTMHHDNRVNNTETHCELMHLRLELAHSPLSSSAYNAIDPVTTPFALRISSATQLRHRPRANPLHYCIQKIIGQIIPYGSPPTSYYIEDVTVNLDQYTLWAYDITKRDFVLGDIIHVCRQFHYGLPDLQILTQSIRIHSLSQASPATTSKWSTTAHFTSTRRSVSKVTTHTSTITSDLA